MSDEQWLRMFPLYPLGSWAHSQCDIIKDERFNGRNISRHQQLYGPGSPGVCLHRLLFGETVGLVSYVYVIRFLSIRCMGA